MSICKSTKPAKMHNIAVDEHFANSAPAKAGGSIRLVKETPTEQAMYMVGEQAASEVVVSWLRTRLPAAPGSSLMLCQLPGYLGQGFPIWMRGHMNDIVACSHHVMDMRGDTPRDAMLAIKLPNGDYLVNCRYEAVVLYYVRLVADRGVPLNRQEFLDCALSLVLDIMESLPEYKPTVRNRRALDRLILPDGMQDDILKDMSSFLEGPDQYDQLGLPWKRGYMFIGPPGNGKTFAARALSNYWCLPLVDLSSCIRPDGSLELGSSVDGIREMMTRMEQHSPITNLLCQDDDDYPSEGTATDMLANSVNDGKLGTCSRQLSNRLTALLKRHPAPIIYVLEDIDKFVVFQSGKSSRHQDAGEVTLHTLLKALDGIHAISSAIIIATTNYANELSEALINRPGRFDRIWEFPKPTQEARVAFLRLHDVQCAGMSLEDIAARLEGLSMAFVEELVKSLRMHYRSTTFTKAEVEQVLDRIKKHEKMVSSTFEKPIRGFSATDQ